MRILVAIDGSETSESVIAAISQWAVETKAEVILLSVIDPGTVHETSDPQFAHALTPAGTISGQTLDVQEPPALLAEDRTQALARVHCEREDYLVALAHQWLPGLSVTARVVDSSDVPEAIVSEADSLGVDLIALATRGRRSLGTALFGSTHEEVVRRAHVPVLLVGPSFRRR